MTPRPTPTAVYPARTILPWPASTPPPSPPPAPTPPPTLPLPPLSLPKRKRRRQDEHIVPSVARRQIIGNDAQFKQAQATCNEQGNGVISCFPTSADVIAQGEWAQFVWNGANPFFAYTNMVNVYLFRADSQQVIQSWPNQSSDKYKAGVVSAQVNDIWWGAQGTNWNGTNQSFPYYFVVIPNNADLSQTTWSPQSTFTAVQTTYADSVIASMSSASSASAASAASRSAADASASSVIASLSSVIASRTETITSDHKTQTIVVIGPSKAGSFSGASTLTVSGSSSSSSDPGATANSNIQGSASDSDFPHWAIAVIVVLGFLALVAGGIATWLLMRRMRQRRAVNGSNRTSTNSGTPMLPGGAGGDVQTPLMGEAGMGAVGVGAAAAVAAHHHKSVEPAAEGAGTLDKTDGASTISRAHSDAVPFSGADAAIMADAFRKALRKPEFTGGQLEEGDTPDSQKEQRQNELLGRELAEEGQNLRAVSSSRDVRVQANERPPAGDDHSTIEGV